MLTKKEVATILKVSCTTINNMMKRGDLKYVRVGKHVRFNEDAIERITKGEGVKVNGRYQFEDTD